MRFINIARTNTKVFVTIVIVYLLLATSPFLGTGIFRFIPTLVLILILLCGLLSWADSRTPRMKMLVSLYCAYAIVSSMFCTGSGNFFTTLLQSTFWCWIYYVANVICHDKNLSFGNYDKFTLALAIAFALAFFIHHRTSASDSELEGDNSVFFVLLMIPWISLVSNNSKRWLATILIVLCSIVSLKRSAIIIGLSSSALIYFRDFLWRRKKSVATLFGAVIIVMLAVGIMYTQSETIDKVSQRFEQVEDDGGSGRDVIYADVINRYEQGSIIQKVFGRGFDSVRRDSTFFVPVSAHNDFLEVLYDFGIIGFVIYVMIHLSLIKWNIRLVRQRSPLGFPVMISYVCFIVMSMVSHLVLYPTYFAILVSFWAFAECKNRQLGYRN